MNSNSENNFRVNWIDGMKISKNHFIKSENALISNINNATKLNITPNNYGLLPSYKEAEKSIDVVISLDGQDTIEVVLNKCLAVTLGGYQINITDQTKALLEQSGYVLKQQYTLDKNETEWYVVIKVNAF